MLQPHKETPVVSATQRRSLDEALQKLFDGQDLEREQTRSLFSLVVRGQLEQVELTALLVALKIKGETPAEIAGAAQALRDAAVPFDSGNIQIADSCGTGGDGSGTFNISTAAAILAAEMGLAIVKHGNRSVSSSCGSADVLERCGFNIQATAAQSRRCLEELGFCFLLAPQYHPGIRHAMPVRKTLRTRTVFNVLGPLLNPARPQRQLVGVYHPSLCRPVAETLGMLGCESALVVHGSGLDEIAIHGPTTAAFLSQGKVETLTIEPGELGLRPRSLDEIRGGDVDENARVIQQVLSGEGPLAHVEAVALNAGALAWISGRVPSISKGLQLGIDLLSSNACLERFRRLCEVSHGA